MSYATLQDLIDRYGEAEILDVADRDRDGTIDTAVVDAALTDAGDLIDGYLAGLYAVPIPAPVPGLVKGWACAIARRQLHPVATPDDVIAPYKDALTQLRDVQAGRLTLQVAGSTPAPAAGAGDEVLVDAQDRVFDATGMRGF